MLYLRVAAWSVLAAALWTVWRLGRPAEPAPCGPTAGPRLEVTIEGEMPEAAIRRDLDADAISAMSKLQFGPGHRARGLTRVDWHVTATVRGRSHRRWGGVCFEATQVALRLEYRAFDIYIDKDIADGTCRYGAVYNHELEHAQLRREEHDRLVETLSAAVERAAPTAAQPAAAANFEAGLAEATQRVVGAARTAMGEVEAEAAPRHAQLDAPENLRAMWQSCPEGG